MAESRLNLRLLQNKWEIVNASTGQMVIYAATSLGPFTLGSCTKNQNVWGLYKNMAHNVNWFQMIFPTINQCQENW